MTDNVMESRGIVRCRTVLAVQNECAHGVDCSRPPSSNQAGGFGEFDYRWSSYPAASSHERTVQNVGSLPLAVEKYLSPIHALLSYRGIRLLQDWLLARDLCGEPHVDNFHNLIFFLISVALFVRLVKRLGERLWTITANGQLVRLAAVTKIGELINLNG